MGNGLWKRGDDAYGRFFDPAQTDGPSGLADPPRPFVVRAAHLDGLRLPVGTEFQFNLHVFDLRTAWAEVLKQALQSILGAELCEVIAEPPLALELHPAAEELREINIRFVTPMELKSGGELAATPEFWILASRIRDRIGTLCQLYGDGPLAMDFAGFGEGAKQVRMTKCDVRRVEATRRSGRTGQTHSLGGFIGEAEYSGDLSEFLPYLRAAQWTGVGRQTTWGKGAIALREPVL